MQHVTTVSALKPIPTAPASHDVATSVAAEDVAATAADEVFDAGQAILAPAISKRFALADKGRATLKGIEKPARLHEVRWQE